MSLLKHVGVVSKSLKDVCMCVRVQVPVCEASLFSVQSCVARLAKN